MGWLGKKGDGGDVVVVIVLVIGGVIVWALMSGPEKYDPKDDNCLQWQGYNCTNFTGKTTTEKIIYKIQTYDCKKMWEAITDFNDTYSDADEDIIFYFNVKGCRLENLNKNVT